MTFEAEDTALQNDFEEYAEALYQANSLSDTLSLSKAACSSSVTAMNIR